MHSPTTALRATLASTLILFSLLALPARAAVVGEQKTAVILVNFTDLPTQPITPAAANSLVFGSVSDFYWEASYQKVFLSGDTYGWFTVPVANGNCDSTLIADEADRAATAAGAALAGYSQIVYMWPGNSGCTWGGTVGKSASGQNRVFINGTGAMTLKTIAHEMGHRFDLRHAHALDCGTSAIGDACTVLYNYDIADTMGGDGHFNAYNKERLGWLGASTPQSIATVTASGRYQIAPFETASAGIKALKIAKGVDATSGQPTWYYVEYRQPTGFDAVLGNAGNLTQGVLVRTNANVSGAETSLLLDMTPNSASTYSDYNDGALLPGRSFTDPVAGLTLTVVAVDASGATIDVSVNGSAPAPVCTRNAPALSITSPGTAVAAGSVVNYTISLTNKDSSACAATSFSLARTLPSGWAGTLATSSLSLSPGASSSTTLSVTSPSNAAAGGYGIGVGSSSSAGSIHTASASATYTVSAPSVGTLTEVVASDKTSYLRGESVYFSALVKADGVPMAGAAVKFTVILPTGSSAVVSATSGSDGYARGTYKTAKTKTAAGNYGLRADASLGGKTATASNSFSVR